jgi:hypothetical protein
VGLVGGEDLGNGDWPDAVLVGALLAAARRRGIALGTVHESTSEAWLAIQTSPGLAAALAHSCCLEKSWSRSKDQADAFLGHQLPWERYGSRSARLSRLCERVTRNELALPRNIGLLKAPANGLDLLQDVLLVTGSLPMAVDLPSQAGNVRTLDGMPLLFCLCHDHTSRPCTVTARGRRGPSPIGSLRTASERTLDIASRSGPASVPFLSNIILLRLPAWGDHPLGKSTVLRLFSTPPHLLATCHIAHFAG